MNACTRSHDRYLLLCQCKRRLVMLEYRVVRGYLRKQSEEVQLRDQPVSEPEYALAIENACCILTVSRRFYWCIRSHYYCLFPFE